MDGMTTKISYITMYVLPCTVHLWDSKYTHPMYIICKNIKLDMYKIKYLPSGF